VPFLVGRTTALYLERTHPRAGADARETSVMRVFDRHRGRGRVFLVELDSRGRVQPPSVPGWEAIDHWRLSGLRAMIVVAYDGLRPGGRALAGGRLLRPGRAPGPVVPGGLQGVVDESTASPRAITLLGWAATARRRPVDEVLAFVGNRLAAAGVPTVRRADVSSSAPDELGFSLALPRDLVRHAREPVRVVATAGAVATPIAFGCNPSVPQVVGC
jgi:hypothetical protein